MKFSMRIRLLAGQRDRWRCGNVSRVEVEAKTRAWLAPAGNADTWRLRQAAFGGRWFGPWAG
jgi:hypothetical protein